MRVSHVNVHVLPLKCCSALTNCILFNLVEETDLQTLMFAQQIVKLRPRVPKGLELLQLLLIMGENE